MHLFIGIAICVSLSWGVLVSFEQLPSEIITKIIVLEPQSVIALSATNKATRNGCLAWAESHDVSFLTDTEKDYTPRNVRFISQHNTKITDDQIAETVIEFVRSLIKKEDSFCYGRIEDVTENLFKNRFKSIASVRPFAVHAYYYNNKKLISYEEIKKLTGLGFLLPFIYVENQPIPLMHYLVKKEFPRLVLSKRCGTDHLASLLQQGMNPFFMHEKKTVIDLLKETEARNDLSKKYRDVFIQSCFDKARQPNDPCIVMYHDKKPFTIEAIQKQIRGE